MDLVPAAATKKTPHSIQFFARFAAMSSLDWGGFGKQRRVRVAATLRFTSSELNNGDGYDLRSVYLADHRKRRKITSSYTMRNDRLPFACNPGRLRKEGEAMPDARRLAP